MHCDSEPSVMLLTGFPGLRGVDVNALSKQRFCLSHCDVLCPKHQSGGSVFLQQEGEQKTVDKLRTSKYQKEERQEK